MWRHSVVIEKVVDVMTLLLQRCLSRQPMLLSIPSFKYPYRHKQIGYYVLLFRKQQGTFQYKDAVLPVTLREFPYTWQDCLDTEMGPELYVGWGGYCNAAMVDDVIIAWKSSDLLKRSVAVRTGYLFSLWWLYCIIRYIRFKVNECGICHLIFL